MSQGIWIGVGLVGQVLFTARTLLQWFASEKAKRTVVPDAYWWLSLTGSALLLVYAGSTRDLVFVAGAAVSIGIYARNLVLSRPRERTGAAPRTLVIAAGIIATVFATVAVAKVRNDAPTGATPVWLAVGIVGQVLWTGRFAVQWWISEHHGSSVLPPAFWVLGTAGSLLMLTYAVVRRDLVFTLAFAFAPIPNIRNLLLERRWRAKEVPA